MKALLVLYATREGQTRCIAEHVGVALRGHGFEAEVLDAATLPTEFTLAHYAAAILAASVHFGKHEPEIVAFVKSHRSELEKMRAIFLSISGAEAEVEDLAASAAARERAATKVKTIVDDFIIETGWLPARVYPVAGALMYRQYNLFLRFIIRMIALCSGTAINTSRNTEYTDWEALDKFVENWIAEFNDTATVHPISKDSTSIELG